MHIFVFCSLMYILSVKSCHSCCSKTVLKGSATRTLIQIWVLRVKFKLVQLMLQQFKVAAVRASHGQYVHLGTDSQDAHTFSHIFYQRIE